MRLEQCRAGTEARVTFMQQEIMASLALNQEIRSSGTLWTVPCIRNQGIPASGSLL